MQIEKQNASNKKNVVIGFDIGTASVGVAIINENNNDIKYIESRTFNEPVEGLAAKTYKVRDRTARAKHRHIQRLKTRKRDIMYFFLENNLLPRKYEILNQKNEKEDVGFAEFYNYLDQGENREEQLKKLKLKDGRSKEKGNLGKNFWERFIFFIKDKKNESSFDTYAQRFYYLNHEPKLDDYANLQRQFARITYWYLSHRGYYHDLKTDKKTDFTYLNKEKDASLDLKNVAFPITKQIMQLNLLNLHPKKAQEDKKPEEYKSYSPNEKKRYNEQQNDKIEKENAKYSLETKEHLLSEFIKISQKSYLELISEIKDKQVFNKLRETVNNSFRYVEYQEEFQQIAKNFSKQLKLSEKVLEKLSQRIWKRRTYSAGPGSEKSYSKYGIYDQEGNKIYPNIWSKTIGTGSLFRGHFRASRATWSSNIYNLLNEFNNLTYYHNKDQGEALISEYEFLIKFKEVKKILLRDLFSRRKVNANFKSADFKVKKVKLAKPRMTKMAYYIANKFDYPTENLRNKNDEMQHPESLEYVTGFKSKMKTSSKKNKTIDHDAKLEFYVPNEALVKFTNQLSKDFKSLNTNFTLQTYEDCLDLINTFDPLIIFLTSYVDIEDRRKHINDLETIDDQNWKWYEELKKRESGEFANDASERLVKALLWQIKTSFYDKLNTKDQLLFKDWVVNYDDQKNKLLKEGTASLSYYGLVKYEIKHLLENKINHYEWITDEESDILKIANENNATFVEKGLIPDTNFYDGIKRQLSYKAIKAYLDTEVISPSVKNSVLEFSKLFNQVIAKAKANNYSISNILIEMPRDSNTSKQKNKISLRQNSALEFKNRVLTKVSNELNNDNLSLERFLNNSNQNLEKLLLLDRQRYFEPYIVNKRIRSSDLVRKTGNYEVDHIIPYSMYKDDSQQNKVLTHKELNKNKGNKLFLKDKSVKDQEKFKDYWVNEIFQIKVEKNDITLKEGDQKNSDMKAKSRQYYPRKLKLLLVKDFTDTYLKGFLNRNLNDTRHIAKLLNLIMLSYFKQEWAKAEELGEEPLVNKKRNKTITGSFTHKLRSEIAEYNARRKKCFGSKSSNNSSNEDNVENCELYKNARYLADPLSVWTNYQHNKLFKKIENLLKENDGLLFRFAQKEIFKTNLLDKEDIFTKPWSEFFRTKANTYNLINRLSLKHNILSLYKLKAFDEIEKWILSLKTNKPKQQKLLKKVKSWAIDAKLNELDVIIENDEIGNAAKLAFVLEKWIEINEIKSGNTKTDKQKKEEYSKVKNDTTKSDNFNVDNQDVLLANSKDRSWNGHHGVDAALVAFAGNNYYVSKKTENGKLHFVSKEKLDNYIRDLSDYSLKLYEFLPEIKVSRNTHFSYDRQFHNETAIKHNQKGDVYKQMLFSKITPKVLEQKEFKFSTTNELPNKTIEKKHLASFLRRLNLESLEDYRVCFIKTIFADKEKSEACERSNLKNSLSIEDINYFQKLPLKIFESVFLLKETLQTKNANSNSNSLVQKTKNRYIRLSKIYSREENQEAKKLQKYNNKHDSTKITQMYGSFSTTFLDFFKFNFRMFGNTSGELIIEDSLIQAQVNNFSTLDFYKNGSSKQIINEKRRTYDVQFLKDSTLSLNVEKFEFTLPKLKIYARYKDEYKDKQTYLSQLLKDLEVNFFDFFKKYFKNKKNKAFIEKLKGEKDFSILISLPSSNFKRLYVGKSIVIKKPLNFDDDNYNLNDEIMENWCKNFEKKDVTNCKPYLNQKYYVVGWENSKKKIELKQVNGYKNINVKYKYSNQNYIPIDKFVETFNIFKK